MSFVEMHPEYRDALASIGLSAAEDFLRLQGSILGGHPDRHVLQVSLDIGQGFLKKEHRVDWRDRLAHAWRGFGWISKSTREGRLLRQLEAAGVGCPVAIAHGEAEGRAFLLLREAAGVADLRSYLNEHPLERLALAPALGQELARIHAAGFQHRDLYSKHILVGRDHRGWRFCFLDWQRGRQRRRLSWLPRLRDLASLDATLAGVMASRRERLLCWRAYLTAQPRLAVRPGKLLRMLCRLSAQLQRKRRIRELRQLPLPAGQQELIWLDGEALCVTPRFQAALSSAPAQPAWLTMPQPPGANCVEQTEVPGTGANSWKLVRRWVSRPWRWLASWWRRPLFPAPEFEQAAAIIRLQRFGIETPQLLALGHRTLRPWQKYSFLLTEPPANVVTLRDYLRTCSTTAGRHALREAGSVLRRIHDAGYIAHARNLAAWAVRPETGEIVLTSVSDLRRTKRSPQRLARQELAKLNALAIPGVSVTDKLRFLLGYHAADKLPRPMLPWVRRLGTRRPNARQHTRERQVA